MRARRSACIRLTSRPMTGEGADVRRLGRPDLEGSPPSADPPGPARRELDKWGAVPPDGESYAMLVTRVQGFLDDVIRRDACWSRMAALRGRSCALGGIAPKRAAKEEIRQGQVLVFEKGACRWEGGSTHID